MQCSPAMDPRPRHVIALVALIAAFAASACKACAKETAQTQETAQDDDAPFEGVITVLSDTDERAAALFTVYEIQGGRYRFHSLPNIPEMGDPAALATRDDGGSLVDGRAMKIFVLVPHERRAFVTDLSIEAFPKRSERTGERSTILGYTCDVWHATLVDDTGEGRDVRCHADRIRFDVASPPASVTTDTPFALHNAWSPFALESTVYDARGVVRLHQRVTKIERRKLPAARFVVAPSFTVEPLLPGGASE